MNSPAYRSKLALSPEDRELIVPMIKVTESAVSPGVTNEVRLSHEQSPIVRPFVSDLVIMYAIDRPTHFEYISNEVAAASGLGLEEIHSGSLRNLPARLGEVQLHDCGAGIFGLSAGGNFEASLLLLDDLWRQLADHLPGEPLAAAPSRDLLFVVGSDRPDAYALISERARIELADLSHALSKSVLVRRSGEWVALTN